MSVSDILMAGAVNIFAESVSHDDIPVKVEYIKNQETHHGLVSLEDELTEIYQHHQWIFLPEYFK